MSLLKMRLIVYIDRYKQITAVANALELKQPTVSFHMKKMEEEWGVKLFESRTGKVLLTPYGKMLLGYASQITALYDEAMTKLSVINESKKKRFVIGCTNAASSYFARSSAMRKLAEKIETAQISVVVHEQADLVAKLRSGLIDLILCGEDKLHTDSSEFRHERISTAELRLLAPSSHPISAMGPDRLAEELGGLEIIELDDLSVQRAVTKWCQSENRFLRSAASYGSVELIHNAVESSGALALLPASLISSRDVFAVLPLYGGAPVWSLFASWSPHYWDQELLHSTLSLIGDGSALPAANE